MQRLLTFLLISIGSIVLLGWMIRQYQGKNSITSFPKVAPFSDSSASPTAKEPIRLLFGGDLMFDRHIRQRMAEHGVSFILQPLEELFQQYDTVIANLEGPVTTFPSRSVNSAIGSTNNFIFTFEPAILPMLKNNRFHILNIGNNHIQNMGVEGVAQTKQLLQQNDIQFFGNSDTETSPAERVLVQSDTTPTLAFVNYNQFVPRGWETALEDVRYATQEAEMVIVLPHWGNEYQKIANQVIQEQAHALIDAGADLIIGGHPHVVQQKEEYQGKTIYYSLGNFVFDQYFQPEVMQGLLVGVEIESDQTLHFTEIPVRIDKSGQTHPVTP